MSSQLASTSDYLLCIMEMTELDSPYKIIYISISTLESHLNCMRFQPSLSVMT